jgi:hypothetical protein
MTLKTLKTPIGLSAGAARLAQGGRPPWADVLTGRDTDRYTRLQVTNRHMRLRAPRTTLVCVSGSCSGLRDWLTPILAKQIVRRLDDQVIRGKSQAIQTSFENRSNE